MRDDGARGRTSVGVSDHKGRTRASQIWRKRLIDGTAPNFFV
jgi:hypothetical protein